MKPRLLDLYCGAGGAARGYQLAGFEVVGVDHRPQRRYPFEFVQGDALEYIAQHGTEYDAIHASPPCQAYSVSRTRSSHRPDHPELVHLTRAVLMHTDRPFVIENVPGAPLWFPVELCGSMFRLGTWCADGAYRALRRHRRFELSWSPWQMPPCPCLCHVTGEKIGVYGNGGGWANRFDPNRMGYKGNVAESRAALGIDWMSTYELSQAIPPAYTQFIGELLLAHVREVSADAAA